MQAPAIDLVRALAARPEFRDAAAAADDLGTMAGHFSVFNSWYQVDSLWEGTFLEQVAPGAFADTIANDVEGMRVLFDHGFDPTVGNKVLGPIEALAEDKTGPAFEVPLFDTSYNRDLLPGLRAGVYGSSFRFRVLAESWDDEPKTSKANPKGVPERTIERAAVMEFGPVTFPANPAATAGMRSLTDQFYDRLRARDTQAYDAAVRAAGRDIPREQAVRAYLDTVLTPEQAAEALRHIDFTGRLAQGAGGGDRTTGQPGSGEPTPSPSERARAARHRRLRLEGVIP